MGEKLDQLKDATLTGLAWLGSGLFALLALVMIFDAPIAALIMLGAAGFLAPAIRQRVHGVTGVSIEAHHRAGAVLGLFFASMLMFAFDDRSDQREAGLEAEREAAAEEQARQDSIRGYFQINRGDVLERATTHFQAGRYDQAEETLSDFEFISDSAVTDLLRELANAKRERTDSLREARLVEEVRGVPASDYGRNRDLYNQLRQIRPDNPQYESRYEHYNRLFQREQERIEREAAIEARRLFAREYESRLMDEWLNVRVTTRGASATTLRIEYVLFNRTWAHHFQQDREMMATIRNLGFTRFEITDGYDFTWRWTFN